MGGDARVNGWNGAADGNTAGTDAATYGRARARSSLSVGSTRTRSHPCFVVGKMVFETLVAVPRTRPLVGFVPPTRPTYTEYKR